ncbi:MAG: peptidoglycan DD-metalloendopeptidase family protein [Pararhodobacter sp.]|nr:peptidoglycan DD-metalloendopeptidase family protein [Pararhodobacter sp.]
MGGALGAALALAACGGGLPTDWDLRRNGAFSTADAAREASPRRPQPDQRGVISYPGYQVVVAQRGETARSIASRLGIDGGELARHNAIDADLVMRGGETLVLPGSDSARPLAAPGSGITESRLDSEPAPGPEPVRHEVQRGETAFSIARLYNITARSLAEWNGLGSDMSVREGQILMIPVPSSISEAADTRTAAARPDSASDAGTGREREREETRSADTAATRPGTGSPTPTPPSASRPMPDGEPERSGAQASERESEPVADMAAQRTEAPRLAMPVEGRIVRAYQRGRNDGIGIGAPAGTAVRAAAPGTVAAITRDTEQVPIMVIRHENNLLTVYANIDDIRVERGARVSRGDTIATVRRGDPSFLHFEVREGLESVDPMPYLQ